jgi:L-ascorbate metabolism protein UlaG (beta-lactamase superfamily)
MLSLARDTSITWLGHATFQIDTPGGKRLLIDPWLGGNPACPDNLKKPDRVDVMLLTHGHFDHVADAVGIGTEHSPTTVGIFELCAWLESKGVQGCSAMNKGGTQAVGDIKATMVHAVHSCGITDGDAIIYGGEACGYVLTLENGFKVYIAGDTAVHSDMRLIGELYAPDLAILPIGDHFTMGPREAALALRLLGCKHVIPSHFGTFPVLTGTPDGLREATADIAGLTIHTLQPGETLT